MNTQTYHWPDRTQGTLTSPWNPADTISHATHLSKRMFMALVPALSILVAAAWAMSHSEATIMVLQAAIWATGFVFLALAADTLKPQVGGLLVTGLTLPLLAVISANVATEFAIVAAAIVAVWVARAIMKR